MTKISLDLDLDLYIENGELIVYASVGDGGTYVTKTVSCSQLTNDVIDGHSFVDGSLSEENADLASQDLTNFLMNVQEAVEQSSLKITKLLKK